MKKPNILWICTDQQRFDTLGCYGNSYVNTPNIDHLAEEGLLFEQAFCQNPVCTPSRSSFLTGRYPRTTRCRTNGQSIPEDEVLVTKLLADAGYATGLAGKLHLSSCHPKAGVVAERRIDDGYHEFHWSHHPSPDWPTNEYIHWLREQGVNFETKPFPGARGVRVGMPPRYHQTTWCAQKAINFIEANAESERPWLFSVNIYDPHHPFDPPLEYLERYRDKLDSIPLPNYVPGELDKKPQWQGKRYEQRRGQFAYQLMSDTDHRWLKAAYWAMCDLIDDQVGRMLSALEQTGQRDNTIVIFMSDHGEMLGDHGIYLKGPFFYEPAVHIPLVLAWPQTVAPAQRSKALVELVDIAPTLLEAAGLEVYPGMQGRSLLPLLSGNSPSNTHREDIYSEDYDAAHFGDGRHHTTMVRTERYKLTVEHGLNSGELYDMQEDPGENKNCWGDPAYLAVKADMLLRLANRMAWTTDPLPPKTAPW